MLKNPEMPVVLSSTLFLFNINAYQGDKEERKEIILDLKGQEYLLIMDVNLDRKKIIK